MDNNGTVSKIRQIQEQLSNPDHVHLFCPKQGTYFCHSVNDEFNPPKYWKGQKVRFTSMAAKALLEREEYRGYVAKKV